jgi:hypothetical protein
MRAEKLNQDQDPDPHLSQNLGAVEAQNRAVDASQWRRGG